MSYLNIIDNLSDRIKFKNARFIEEIVNPGLHFKNIHVLLTDDKHDYDKSNPFRTLIIHKAPKPYCWARWRLYPLVRGWQLAKEAIKIVKKYNLKVVSYFYGNIWDTGIPVILTSKRTGAVSFVTVQNDYSFYSRFEPAYTKIPFLNDLLEKWVYRNADIIRCVSRFLVDYVAKKGIAKEKIFYISNKIDLEKFKEVEEKQIESFFIKYNLGRLKNKKIAFFAGRLNCQKNLFNTIKAFAKAKEKCKELYFLIAGDGPLKIKLERLVKNLEIEDFVIFSGMISHEYLAPAYRFSDFLIFVTRYEGQPRTLLEGFASGLPAIGNSEHVHRDLIINDGAEKGIVVPPDDINAITNAIIKFYKDNEFLQKCARNCIKNMWKYDIETIKKKEIYLLNTLI